MYNQGLTLLWSTVFLTLFVLLWISFEHDANRRSAEILQQELSIDSTQWPLFVHQFYEQRQYEPVWFEAGRPSTRVDTLLEMLRVTESSGIPLEPEALLRLQGTVVLRTKPLVPAESLIAIDLELTRILLNHVIVVRNGVVNPQHFHSGWEVEPTPPELPPANFGDAWPKSFLERSEPAHAEYAALKKALTGLHQMAEKGGWPEIPAGPDLRRGDTDERVCILRLRLGFDCNTDSPYRYDEGLEKAIKKFQRLHGIPEDGMLNPITRAALNVSVEKRVAQVLVNMERWRWMPDSLGDRHIRVNVPDYSLTAYVDGRPHLEISVIVGKLDTPTKIFHSRIQQIVLAPYWYVPASIAGREILPILQRDSDYLSRNRMSVFQDGSLIDPASISWKALSAGRFPYTLRQAPGASNPLGGLRFAMPNDFDIGMHDTPERRLFTLSKRALSHGCIRLESPLSLVLFVLNDAAWTQPMLKDYIARGIQRPVQAKASVPVYVLYQTAWVDDAGSVHFREDIYGHDRRLIEALEQARQVGPALHID